MEWVGYILWKNTNGEPRMVMLLSLRNISPSLCKRVAQVSLVAFLTSLLQRPITPCLIINYLKTLASNDYSLFIPVFIFFFLRAQLLLLQIYLPVLQIQETAGGNGMLSCNLLVA